ncbi:MAG: hypothetical protein K2Q22_01635 [Cytophagales bacterium]|nr:hypothetical protein [Cytophagales bacterium]
MKRIKILIILGFISSLAVAQEDPDTLAKNSVHKLLKNGFYTNFGLAFPTFGILNNPNSSSFNFEPHVEFGNQWYLLRNAYIGLGARISWFQVGYSSYSINSVSPTSNFDFRVLKVAPELSYVINSNMALDFSVEVSPTLMVGGNANSNPSYSYFIYGLLYAPGLRFRFLNLAAGADLAFGPMSYSINAPGISNQVNTYNMVAPRFYLGFQF